MGWWKADTAPESKPAAVSTPTSALIPNTTATTPIAPHPISPTDTASSCPVDPKTRSIWLQQAQARQQQQSPSSQSSKQSSPPNHPVVLPSTNAASQECSSDRIDQTLPNSSQAQTKTYQPGTRRPLSQDREISTIPRGYPTTLSSPSPQAQPAIPSNSETETGPSPSGNWIYPSESQFFSAVMRKQTTADPKELATSISSIIPIHNAVNERAWLMIRAWEGETSKPCGGPKLLRFEGMGAGAKSPRAWVKSWSGYTEPFDRHDWTVQRCDGTEVEYVIDFYQGKGGSGDGGLVGQGAGRGGGAGLNFYLDVRPKLNSFEGCKMRFEKAFGLK